MYLLLEVLQRYWTQAEYVEKVHTYDRKQLDVYQETVQEVKDLKASLESDQKKLQELSGEYKSQESELTTMIESKNTEVANLDSMIQEAARKAAGKAAAENRRQKKRQLLSRIKIIIIIMVVQQVQEMMVEHRKPEMAVIITCRSRTIVSIPEMQLWIEHVAGLEEQIMYGELVLREHLIALDL